MSARISYLIGCVVLCGLVASKFNPVSGLTSLIRFGEPWESRRHHSLNGLPIETIRGSNGYDGQFYAQIALDPLLSDPGELNRVIDAPSYRARRILVPAVAGVLGGGSAWWTLQVYAAINVACWIILGWVLAKEVAGDTSIQIAKWAGCMFGMGVLESVRQSLVDLPALLLLVFAIRLSRSESKERSSALFLAAAALAKETSLIGAIALKVPGGKTPSLFRSALTWSLIAAPMMAWSAYVWLRLGFQPLPGEQGNFDWPALGAIKFLFRSISSLAHGSIQSRYAMGLIAVASLATQVIVLLRAPDPKSSWWRVGVAYAALLFVLGDWVWSGYWAVTRAVLPMTIAFNLTLSADKPRRFWALWAAGNLPALHAIWRFL